MFKTPHKIILSFIFFTLFISSWLKAEIIDKINIEGNERISTETIKMFTDVSIGDDLSENDLNQILKKLYNTNFFETISIKLSNEILIIKVTENPIIQNISYEGIKSSQMLEELKKKIVLKSRSSFNEILLNKDIGQIKSFLKDRGYFFSKIETLIEELEDNKINLSYKINLGE